MKLTILQTDSAARLPLSPPHGEPISAFAALASDEEREYRALFNLPGTFYVVATHATFTSLPEYAHLRRPSNSRHIRSSRLTTNVPDNISPQSSPSSHGLDENLGDDPNVVILNTFEAPLIGTFHTHTRERRQSGVEKASSPDNNEESEDSGRHSPGFSLAPHGSLQATAVPLSFTREAPIQQQAYLNQQVAAHGSDLGNVVFQQGNIFSTNQDRLGHQLEFEHQEQLQHQHRHQHQAFFFEQQTSPIHLNSQHHPHYMQNFPHHPTQQHHDFTPRLPPQQMRPLIQLPIYPEQQNTHYPSSPIYPAVPEMINSAGPLSSPGFDGNFSHAASFRTRPALQSFHSQSAPSLGVYDGSFASAASLSGHAFGTVDQTTVGVSQATHHLPSAAVPVPLQRAMMPGQLPSQSMPALGRTGSQAHLWQQLPPLAMTSIAHPPFVPGVSSLETPGTYELLAQRLADADSLGQDTRANLSASTPRRSESMLEDLIGLAFSDTGHDRNE